MTLDVREQELVKGMLSNQLNYWLNESGCPEEYAGHISAGIALLNGLGEQTKAADWKNSAEQTLGAASIHAVLRDAPSSAEMLKESYKALAADMQDAGSHVSWESINKKAIGLLRETQQACQKDYAR